MGMKLEQGRISSSQLIFMSIAVSLSTATILGLASRQGASALVIAILGSIEGGIFVWIFSALSARFLDKTFVEISEIVFGKYLGKVVAGLYLWFLFHIGALVLYDSSEFVMATAFEETPMVVLRISFILVSMYAVKNGVEVIARCTGLVVPLYCLSTVTTLLLSIPNINMRNFLPLLDIPLKELLLSAHITAVLPVAESVVLLMVMPFMNENRRAPTILFKALVAGYLLGLMITIRNIGVLGNTAAIIAYPSYESVELVNVGRVLTRIEVLVSLSMISLGFLTITVFFYAVVLGMSQLCGLRSYQPLVIPIGILFVIMAGLQAPTLAEAMDFIEIVGPLYHPFFEVVIPLLTLVVAMVRRLPKQSA